MKGQVRVDACGNITIHMEGSLHYHSGHIFQKQLEDLISKNPHSTITLNLHNLDFVGSSGIGFFAKTIKAASDQHKKIKISNVKSEFLKVFKLFDLDMGNILTEEPEIKQEAIKTQEG